MTSSIIPPHAQGIGVASQNPAKLVLAPNTTPTTTNGQFYPGTAATGSLWNPGPQAIWLSHNQGDLVAPLSQFPQAFPLPPSATMTWDFSPDNGTFFALAAAANVSQVMYVLLNTQLFLSPEAVTGGPRIPWAILGINQAGPGAGENAMPLVLSYDDKASTTTTIFTVPAGYTRKITSIFCSVQANASGYAQATAFQVYLRKSASGVTPTTSSPIVWTFPAWIPAAANAISSVVDWQPADGLLLYEGESFIVTTVGDTVAGDVTIEGYDWAAA